MKTTPLVVIGGAAPSTALRRCIAPFSRINNGFNNITTITIKTPQQLPLSSQFPFSLPRPLSLLAMASSSSSSSTQSPTQNASAADSTAEFNVFQLIQAHQGKAARLPPVEEIRTVLDHSLRGMLSTFSQKYEGYPSGSMVDFACDAYGSPILAISSLAVHTKDLLANPKCSLLVAKDPEDRTDLIITLHGDVVSVSENDREAIRTAYLARHPNAFWVDFAHMLDLDCLGFNVKADCQGDTFKLRVPFPRRAVDRKDVKTLIVEMLQAAKSQVNGFYL